MLMYPQNITGVRVLELLKERELGNIIKNIYFEERTFGFKAVCPHFPTGI